MSVERPRIAVFGPSPLLTVMIEPSNNGPEVHLHAGGQGFWVARLAARMGAEVALCSALGGEPGRVLRTLIEAEPIELHSVLGSANGVYIHDRRGGERMEVASVEARPPDRHAVDELYGVALGAGLDADITMLTGCQPPELIDADFYRRLARDLRANRQLVIADLTGPPLEGVLKGGVDLLKLSHAELLGEQAGATLSRGDILAAAHELYAAGARHVLITRGPQPALLVDGSADAAELELSPPVFETLDEAGTGDSLFAATGVGLARGLSMVDALRLGMAAGALNATRRGLGTGTRQEIERLAAHVTVTP